MVPAYEKNLTVNNMFLSTDADAECAPYYYTPVAIKLSSFPIIWQPAQILPGDMNAQSKWDSTAFSVPNNISIKVY